MNTGILMLTMGDSEYVQKKKVSREHPQEGVYLLRDAPSLAATNTIMRKSKSHRELADLGYLWLTQFLSHIYFAVTQ
jgi:hypothetical protein